MKNPNNLKIKQYYNSFLNQLNLDIKRSKEFFYRNKCENASGNIKFQCKVVNELIQDCKISFK